MKIFITGGTGYVGGPVVARLARAHDVTALARTDAGAQGLARVGATPLHGALDDVTSFRDAAAQADAIVHLAAGRHPVDELLALAGGRVFVYTSVLFLLGDTAAADEETSPRPLPHLVSRLEEEQRVLAAATSDRATAVIRPGMVYGGGDGGAVSMLFRTAADEGAAAYVGDGANEWPLVHRDDVADLFALVVEAQARGVFHAVDEAPATVLQIARAASEAAACEGRTRAIALDDARQFLGPFADALVLNQHVTAPRSHALGWAAARPPFVSDAPRAYDEWRVSAGHGVGGSAAR